MIDLFAGFMLGAVFGMGIIAWSANRLIDDLREKIRDLRKLDSH